MPTAKPKRVKKPPRKMTLMQQRFAGEFVIDLDATAAAKRAGYSAANASSLGYQLLQKPLVVAEIAKLNEARMRATGLTAESVLGMLRDRLNHDPADYFDDDGNPKKLKELTAKQRRALDGMKRTAHGIEIKLANRHDEEKLAMAHLNLLNPERAGPNTSDIAARLQALLNGRWSKK